MKDQTDISLAAKLGFQPGRVIRLFGMRRSGNHAVVNWLARNAASPLVFLNNCIAGKCPADTARALEVNGIRMPLGEAPLATLCEDVPDGAVLLVSYEDVMPDLDDLSGGLTPGLEANVALSDIVLFRNFLNWTASLLRKLKNNDTLDVLDRTRIMAIALNTYRDGLELISHGDSRIQGLRYDRWVSRPRHRSRLLQTLGFDEIDNELGLVQPYGGGSSFQKDTKAADDLSPLTRWREMVNDPEYQILLLTAGQDPELMDLLERLMPQDAAFLKDYLDQARFPYVVQFAEGEPS